jgi:hypothetical protein
MNAVRRIEALELAIAGPTMSEDEAEAIALQQVPNDELEARVREILVSREPPAEDDMSKSAVLERKVRTLIARKDAERARH